MITDEITLGRKIELARRRRGLSRELLGDLIGRSSEWIRQVERDERDVDRLSLLLALAKVLKVADIAAFLGVALPKAVQPPAPVAEVRSLRELFYRQQPALATLPGHGGRYRRQVDDPHLSELRQQLDCAWATWQDSPLPYSTTMRHLPALIAALSELEPTPAASEMLAHAYRLASGILRRLGDLPAALLASERAVVAARHGADPLIEPACVDGFADTLVRLGSAAHARQVCLDAAAGLEERLRGNAPAKISILGALWLTAAEAAIADDDHVTGERLLAQARLAAARLGADRNDYASAFGPTGVEIHAVRISLRLGRVRQALRIAETVDVDRVPARQHRSRHYITVARAHVRQDNDTAAVFTLLKAEGICPEELHINSEARELLGSLLRRDNAMTRSDVWAMAERTGLA